MTDIGFRCVICRDIFHGWGNDPEPVAEIGRCCATCNSRVVIPTRLELAANHDARIDNHAQHVRLADDPIAALYEIYLSVPLPIFSSVLKRLKA